MGDKGIYVKSVSVRSRKQLSVGQIKVLGIVYKFRFVSSELLAKCLGKDRSTIYERLAVIKNNIERKA